MENTVTVDKEKLQKLISCFRDVCSLCDELDIYEHKELDESMKEMKEFVNENFNQYM
jgi:hypothetical protein